jgi:hypothetical protein
MKKFVTNAIIIIFSLTFAVRVVTIFAADRLLSIASTAKEGPVAPEKALDLLNLATKLDSTNAELYYKQYELLNLSLREAAAIHPSLRGAEAIPKTSRPRDVKAIRKTQIHLLRTAIALRPLWPKYHLSYGLTVGRMSPNPNIVTRRLILSELKKAADLKPYSTMYQNIYKKYAAKYGQ